MQRKLRLKNKERDKEDKRRAAEEREEKKE